MASIGKEIMIDVPAPDIWAAIRDFGNVHRLVPGLLSDCRLDGDARVVTFRGGGRTARELLVSIDDDFRRLVYAEPDGPFITRSASCQVFAVDDRSSRFVWTQDLLPDELASLISGNMEKALPELKRTLESIHGESAHAVTDATPLVDEEDLVAVAGERETLEGFLEYHRRVLGGKLRGLSEQDARRRLVPSLTTLLGLVSHAAAVERNWFQHHLGGMPREEITGNARGDKPSWDVGADRSIAGVIAEFDTACATSRQIAAGFTLDQTVPHDELGQVSLRWIYVHIIREHARHIGHADILREQIDGATGDLRHLRPRDPGPLP